MAICLCIFRSRFDQFIDRARAQFPEFDHPPVIGDPRVPRHGVPPNVFQCGGDCAGEALCFSPLGCLPPIEVGGEGLIRKEVLSPER